MSSEFIRQAYIAIQNGDRITARTLLRRAIIKEPRNELAWFLLAQVVDKREQSIDCLEQVIKINPDNENAQKALTALKHEKRKAPKPASSDTSKQAFKPTATAERAEFPSAESPSTKAADALSSNSSQMATTAGMGPSITEKKQDRGAPAEEFTPPHKEVDLSKHRRRLHINWPLLFGGLIVSFVIFIAITGPSLAPKDPLEENVIIKVGDTWEIPPFPAFSVPGFPLGSDQFGRDLLSRVLWAIQPTLIMVAIVSVVRLILGAIIGLGAGWSVGRSGKWLDTAISAALSIPVLMVALGAIAMLGAELGLIAFIIGLSINGWGETARIVREQTQAIKGQLYVEAARAMGSSSMQILNRHVMRQIMPMIWMLFAFEISSTMMVTAALGFLGYYIGGDVWIEVGDFVSRRTSGMPELGQMLATSWTTLTEPWPMVLTGTVIFVTILGFNLLGEGLRLRLDPERASRNSPLARATRKASWWLEQYITYPLGTFVRKNALPVGVASALLLAVSGGIYWWQTELAGQLVQSAAALENPGGNLWSAERSDPYGSLYSEVADIENPRILWNMSHNSGFSGGPVVSADGTIYILANDGVLMALDSGGTAIWSAEVPATPVGSPALDGGYNIYVVDTEGGLTKFSPDGNTLWHLNVDERGVPLHGPIATPDERIFYLIEDHTGDHLVSVSSEGELIWIAETDTRSADSIPRLGPKGDVIFVKNKVIDANDGSILDVETPTAEDPVLSGREQFFTGADGRSYLQTGHIVMQWVAGTSGLEIVQAAEWNYRSAGLNQFSTYPADAGVTPGQTVWVFYTWQYGGTQIAWMDITGKLIGIAPTGLGRRSRMVGVDGEQTYYICGVYESRAQSEISACFAYAQGSTEPLWELPLEGAEGYIIGAALVEGRLYVTTQDSMFYAIGSSPSGDQASLGVQPAEPEEVRDTSESNETPTSEAEEAEGNLLNTRIAWQYQVPEAFRDRLGLWYDFQVTEDGWVYIQSEGNTIYVLNPQGELTSQFHLPGEPYQEGDDGFAIKPILLPDRSLLLISQENIAYGLAQDGSILWEMTLETAPQAYPAIGRGQVYVVDHSANLYVLNSQGLVWQYKPEGDAKGTTGALVGPDDTIYYAALVDKQAYLHALNPDGTLKWVTAVRTSFFYDELKINGPGKLLFLKEDIYDTQQGALLDVEPPFDVDEYIMGDDGLTYLRSGHTVIRWEITEAGMQAVETAQWNYQGFNTIGGHTLSAPFSTRVTAPQVIWMSYGERYIWLALDGTVLGSPPAYGGSLNYIDYPNTRITYCHQEPGEALFRCDAYTTASNEPSENFSFIGIPNTNFGFFDQNAAYAVTDDNVLYKINVTLPNP